jgi:hypothetical protein
MSDLKELINIRIDKQKAKDTGMVAAVLLIIAGIWLHNSLYFQIALISLLADLIVPQLFIPLAYLWFGLANIMGTFVSKILLSLVYVLVVLPVGFLRRISGKDTLQLKGWKRGNESVFRSRNHSYTSSDIDKPY